MTSSTGYTFQVTNNTGTGYVWTPYVSEGCLATTSEVGYSGNSPGSATVTSFHLETVKGIKHPLTCVFSLALVRPWLFKGFTAEGTAIDQGGVA
jgi:hypothetical protein